MPDLIIKGIAWAFAGSIPVCLVIRFLASHGTMRRTTPKDLEAVIARRAALQARRAALRARS